MRTIYLSDFSTPVAERSVVTIGNFDGVHRGHREIFKRVCRYAAEAKAVSVVVTFDPHPLQLLSPDRAPLLITSREQKRSLIAESDIDLLVVIPFTREFAQLPATQFVETVLVGALGVCRLVIGHDYAFGKNREGDERLLLKLAEQFGFTLESIDPIGDGTLIFSSSEVRRLVTDGNVAAAIPLLGRCHRVAGQVVRGREIGKTIGFPTANIHTENQLIPAEGVYSVWVEVFGELQMGACSIGTNPTFGGIERTIEVFLFDFDGELYGCDVTVHFVERLRAIVRFPNVSALTDQIAKDIQAARLSLASNLPAGNER